MAPKGFRNSWTLNIFNAFKMKTFHSCPVLYSDLTIFFFFCYSKTDLVGIMIFFYLFPRKMLKRYKNVVVAYEAILKVGRLFLSFFWQLLKLELLYDTIWIHYLNPLTFQFAMTSDSEDSWWLKDLDWSIK